MPPRKEQQSHLPTLPLSPGPHSTNSMLQLRHQKKPPLPSLDFPGPKADFFPPEVCLHFLQKCPQPFPRPQQLQLLSQAWLGMEMCSWHRNSTPEPAFGYQPWVWFEVLPQENVRPLAEPFSLRPWRKSQPPTPPLLCPPVSVHTFQKHKQQLPGTSANQLGPKFTIASARIILIAVHPPKKSRRNHL